MNATRAQLSFLARSGIAHDPNITRNAAAEIIGRMIPPMKTDTPKLDSFLRAYLITALWSSTLDNGDPMDRDYSPEDLAPETLAKCAADCAKFEADNAETIAAAIETGELVCGPHFDAHERAAHDFWLTRNGHGAGFWDGDWPEPYAAKLTAAAKAFGSCDLYVGDDGKIYL